MCSSLLLLFSLPAHSNSVSSPCSGFAKRFPMFCPDFVLVLPRFCSGFAKVLPWFCPGCLANTINNPEQWEGLLLLCPSCYQTMHETRHRTPQKYDHGLLLQPNATVARIGPKLCANAILDQNEKQTLSGEAKLLLGFHWFLSLNQHMLWWQISLKA